MCVVSTPTLNSPILFLHGLSCVLYMQKLTFSKVFHTGNILKFNLDQELYSKH